MLTTARDLYDRFRHLIHEFAAFGVIGTVGFLVTEGVFNLMISQHVVSFGANAVSTLIAAAVTYLGNRYWTFRHRERTTMPRETSLFIALNVVGILIQQACIEFAKHEFGRHDKLTLNIAFLVGVALATVFRFWSYRKWVWAAKQPPAGHEELEPALAGPGAGPGPDGAGRLG